MRRRKQVLLALLPVISAGCLSYAARIDVSPGQAPLSSVEIEEMVATVGAVATRFGFRENPNLAELRRISEESKEYDHRIIADYTMDGDRRTHGRMIVWVGVHKLTGAATVMVRDLDSIRTTSFSASLEQEIVAALSAGSRPWAIEVKRETVGPNLGP